MPALQNEVDVLRDALEEICRLIKSRANGVSDETILGLIYDLGSDALSDESEVIRTKSVDIDIAKQLYYKQTHPSIMWGFVHPQSNTLHAMAYDYKGWCGVFDIMWIPGNTEGMNRCMACEQLLRENGIEAN